MKIINKLESGRTNQPNEPAGRIDEDNLPVALETCQDSVVKLCVLANPRIAVVDVRGRDVLVGNVGQNDKPLLKELCSESIKIKLSILRSSELHGKRIRLL